MHGSAAQSRDLPVGSGPAFVPAVLLPDLPNSESRSHIPSVAAKHGGVPLHQISLLLVFL
jgi:hypothetical protein